MTEKHILMGNWAEALLCDAEELQDAAEECRKAARNYIKDNQRQILQNILEEIFRQYPEWREDYIYDLKDPDVQMPAVNQPEELLELVRPEKIRLLNVEKEKQVYYAVNFSCLWDEAYNLWSVMYKDRVVSLGETEETQLEWIAENDSSRKEFEEIKSQKKMACNIRF